MAMIRDAVSTFSRLGLLNANETAVFDTPAASATSAIVTRRATWCSTLPPQAMERAAGPIRGVLRVAAVYHRTRLRQTGLANRFTDPNRTATATSMGFNGIPRRRGQQHLRGSRVPSNLARPDPPQ